jgi:hypothetical protein
MNQVNQDSQPKTPKTPKTTKPLDTKDIEYLIEELDQAHKDHIAKETRWESFKWDLDWYYNDYISSIREFFRGVKNFWTFRKDIFRFRWYDSGFLHQVIRSRLNNMADNWHQAHYVNSENEEKELRELVAMLDLIDVLEDECTLESSKEIDEIYNEFGKRLFGIKDYIQEHNGKTTVTTMSAFRKFWD